jgi:hypothetical protein
MQAKQDAGIKYIIHPEDITNVETTQDEAP